MKIEAIVFSLYSGHFPVFTLLNLTAVFDIVPLLETHSPWSCKTLVLHL